MKIYVYINGTPHNLIGDISDNGTPLFSGGEDAELPIADSSYRFSEIMGDDNVVVNFSMPVFYEFPIGCRINVDFIEYTLLELGQVTKQNERWYDYTLTFESPAKTLSCYKFRNHVDGRLNFTLTAQPQEFLDHICRNMNMREGSNEWTVGDCIVSSEKTQSFSHNSVLDALNSIAQLFETEWEIIGKRISLRKIEYNKTNPINLSYGKGNGFKSGISRQLSGEKAVDVLWVEGSDRNIDGRKYTYRKDGQSYHANKLRLPRNSRWVFVPSDGTVDLNGKVARGTLFTRTEWNNKTEAEKAAYGEFMAVKTDKDGFGVERESRINNGYEESVDLPDIYPHKVLQVAQADLVNRDNRFWDIKATTADGSAIPNYNDCLIGGVDVTIIFNTGMLTGKEFNLANQGTENNPKCYDPETRVFKIQPAEIDGITMPDLPLTDPEGTGYVPAEGDEFGVFHVQLPQEYIEEAERELLLTACEYLHKHGEVEVEFNGTVDGIWAKQNWADIFPFIKVGGYVRFTDTKLVTEGKLMRILSIKNYLNNPHSPEITLSNSSVSQSVSSELKKIPQNQVYTLAEIDKQVAYTQRSFRDTKDTQKALEEAFVNQGEYFSESITPASVETMQMIVGSEDLQFMFGSATYTTSSNRKKVTRFDEFNYSPNYTNGKLTCTKVQMRHYSYTANKNTISPTANTVASFPYWEIAARTFTPSNPNQTYYLYAVCSKSATNANNLGYITEGAGFSLEAAPQAHTEQSFYFLVGILNREKDGTRSFATVYGYSEVLGNRITTGRIVSADGQTWFDLTTGEIRTNKSIKFSWQGSQQDLADAMSRVNNNASNANALAGAVQTNLDNLQIGGRNLFGLYSDCGTTLEGFTSRANVTLDTNNKCAKMVGAADRSCYFYSSIPFYPTPNKIMTISCDVKIENIVNRASNFMCEVYFSGQYVGSTWYGTGIVATYLDGKKLAVKTRRFSDVITDTKWHRFACVGNFWNVAYNQNLPPAIYLRGATGTMWIKNVKYEEGEVPTAWSPAPEDAEKDIAEANTKAANAKAAADNAKTAADTANNTINAMNGDSTFSIIEKKSLRKDWQAIHGAANTNGNADASGTYKKAVAAASGTNVSTAAITNAYNALKSYLNDKKLYVNENTTGFNQTQLGNLFKAYYVEENALFDNIADYFSTEAKNLATNAKNKAEEADNKAIYAQRLAEATELMTAGYMMFRDPEFRVGKNSTGVYTWNGHVTNDLVNDGSAPNSTGKVLRIITNGDAMPNFIGMGGFRWANISHANDVYIYHIKAKIPVGYSIGYGSNAHGNNPQDLWCTSQSGDNTWREYVLMCRCGSSGNFSSIGYFYLYPQSGYSTTSVTWYVAYATAYDCSSFEAMKSCFENPKGTEIQGGVVMTNVVQVRNRNNVITAGMSGLNENAQGKNVRFWAGGAFNQANNAAKEADQDVHPNNMPILLLDDGYNSNIGIFKVLENAIAVMKNGQCVRISTNSYNDEWNNYAPSPRSTGSCNGTLYDTKSTDLAVTGNRTIQTSAILFNYPNVKNIAITITIPITFSVAYTSPTAVGQLRVTAKYKLQLANGTQWITIKEVTYTKTENIATSGQITATNTIEYFGKFDLKIAQIRLVLDSKIAEPLNISGTPPKLSYGNSTAYCYNSVSNSQIVVQECKSCCFIADGGMGIAYDSDNYMKVGMSSSATFDFKGLYFTINGEDYVRSKEKYTAIGNGYINATRRGALVTIKINIPQSYLGTVVIPYGYRPAINIDTMLATSNSRADVYLGEVLANGQIRCVGMPSNVNGYGHATYVSNDPYPT